jgi:hypothetical protein
MIETLVLRLLRLSELYKRPSDFQIPFLFDATLCLSGDLSGDRLSTDFLGENKTGVCYPESLPRTVEAMDSCLA